MLNDSTILGTAMGVFFLPAGGNKALCRAGSYVALQSPISRCAALTVARSASLGVYTENEKSTRLTAHAVKREVVTF